MGPRDPLFKQITILYIKRCAINVRITSQNFRSLALSVYEWDEKTLRKKTMENLETLEKTLNVIKWYATALTTFNLSCWQILIKIYGLYCKILRFKEFGPMTSFNSIIYFCFAEGFVAHEFCLKIPFQISLKSTLWACSLVCCCAVWRRYHHRKDLVIHSYLFRMSSLSLWIFVFMHRWLLGPF